MERCFRRTSYPPPSSMTDARWFRHAACEGSVSAIRSSIMSEACSRITLAVAETEGGAPRCLNTWDLCSSQESGMSGMSVRESVCVGRMVQFTAVFTILKLHRDFLVLGDCVVG